MWTFSQQFSTQGISFIISIFLARLLLPSEFGLLGMVSVFIAIGTSLMDSGMSSSLIRSTNPQQDDYSTVFFFNLATSVVIYIVIFFTAPFIADFFKQPVLKNIVRLYCLSFIITASFAVQQTRLTKVMDFKTQMIIAIPSLLISGVLGIFLAYFGFGVWSLVYMGLCQTLLNSIQYWLRTKWTPSFVFKRDKFREHFSFGYKLTLSGLLESIFNNIYQIIIGRFFSPSQVGFFTRADSLKQLPVSNISAALNKVTYPLFASINSEDRRLKRVYKQIMQMVLFIIAPTLIFMGILAEPIFRFLFTEKWLPAVPYFQILCLTGILYPIHAYNLNILKVKGRSDLYLKLEIYKKILIVISIIIGINFGIIGLLWAQVVISIFAFFINTYYTGKYLGYSAWDQSKDLLPILCLATCAGFFVYLLDVYFIKQHVIDIFRIFVGPIVGFLIYASLAWKMKFNSIKDIQTIILKK